MFAFATLLFLCTAVSSTLETEVVGEDNGTDACPCDAGTNRSALMELYMATQGPSWGPGANWGTGAPICAWVGLSCNGTGLVMNLESFNLNGTLPDDFGAHLANLEVVSIALTAPNFCVPLPASLSLATRLTTLSFYGQFGGPLPDSWGALLHLESLWIRGDITGPLPRSWGNMSRLQTLNLASETRSLNGSLPNSWAAMKALSAVNLNNNQLSGPLPPSWARMANLRFVDLGVNSLSGPLPPSWAALTALETLKLHFNGFTGPLPEEWSSMSNLTSLHLGENALTGTLPASWAALRNLQKLHLNSNALIGGIPEAWWNFSPSVLWLFNNRFNGTVPRNWTVQQDTTIGYTIIGLGVNAFHGPLPTLVNTCDSAVRFSVSFNNFSGPIPASWYGCDNLVVDVDHNQLSGTPDLCALGNQSVYGYNNFTGMPDITCFMPDACNNDTLQERFLRGNHFCGVCGLPNCTTCTESRDHSIAEEASIDVLEVKDSAACCQACRANAACVAAVLVPHHQYTYCYLKNTTTPLVPKPGHTVLFR